MGQKYRPNYWKNAALLTGSDVVLRLAGLGLRIGLAVVKGLALPRQIPCAGVSTMAALATSPELSKANIFIL